MAEIHIIVRDRFGQEARQAVTVEVIRPAPILAPPPLEGVGIEPPRAARPRRRVLLGQILLEAAIVNQAQLELALAEQRKTGERLGKIVLSMGLGTQEGIAAAIAQQLGIEFVRLTETPPDEPALLTVPEAIARRHQVIPLREQGRDLIVGMVDPLDIVAVDDLRRLTGFNIVPAAITLDDFQRALGQYPSMAGTVSEVIEEIRPSEFAAAEESAEVLRAVATQAPIVRLANLMILQAIRARASDIHIEPQPEKIRVRQRVDGVLYPTMTSPSHIHPALVSRLKIMSNLNIAERRVPQDGRIELKVDGRPVDLRVSTIPTVFGEKVVMRVLDKSGAFVGVDRLGLLPRDRQRFEAIIGKPHGVVLLMGPTGCGKTTTLYAILNRLNTPQVNIMTIEDPVEYQMPGISQVQVNPTAGLTFASGLRAFLRQDPDIIMVGEIRDDETAHTAVQAALTGHLVLSTLHTNDTAGAVSRLAGMGVEPFLMASSIVGLIAQRLVRVLCERCREPYEPSAEILERLGVPHTEGLVFYRPVGCPYCNHIGYRGRIGVFEILPVDADIKPLIAHSAPATEIRAAAIAAGMRTLQDDALAKVATGTTSLEEALRVVLVEGAPVKRPQPALTRRPAPTWLSDQRAARSNPAGHGAQDH
jgi:type IV pilus assembly protein PilB